MIRRPGVGLSEAPITAIDSGRNSGSSRIAPRFVGQLPLHLSGFADAAEAPAPSRSGPAEAGFDLEFHLLGDAERVVDLDTKVTDGAFEPCVPEQELNCPQIAGLLVNLRGLGPTH